MDDFAGFDFDGGEPLSRLLARAGSWRPPQGCVLAVGHAGWITAWAWPAAEPPTPSNWPRPLRYATSLSGDF